MEEWLERWTRGDWAGSPWFTVEEDEVFAAMGFSLEARRDAAIHLKRVFTDDVCREIGADPERGYVTARPRTC